MTTNDLGARLPVPLVSVDFERGATQNRVRVRTGRLAKSVGLNMRASELAALDEMCARCQMSRSRFMLRAARYFDASLEAGTARSPEHPIDRAGRRRDRRQTTWIAYGDVGPDSAKTTISVAPRDLEWLDATVRRWNARQRSTYLRAAARHFIEHVRPRRVVFRKAGAP